MFIVVLVVADVYVMIYLTMVGSHAVMSIKEVQEAAPIEQFLHSLQTIIEVVVIVEVRLTAKVLSGQEATQA
jgi:hypothetical protein